MPDWYNRLHCSFTEISANDKQYKTILISFSIAKLIKPQPCLSESIAPDTHGQKCGRNHLAVYISFFGFSPAAPICPAIIGVHKTKSQLMSQCYQWSSCWWEENREQGDRLLSVCCTGWDRKHRGAVGEATDEEVVCFHCRIAAVRKHTQSRRPFTAAIYGAMQRPLLTWVTVKWTPH